MSKRLAIVRLQHYANILAEFFDRWKLKVNAQKTGLVIFTRKRNKEKIPDFHIHNQRVEIKTNVKYLGVILNNKLNFQTHMENTKNKDRAEVSAVYSEEIVFFFIYGRIISKL